MLLIPHLSLPLLALSNRREALLGIITSNTIANELITTSSPDITADTSSQLYLARPMGTRADAGKNAKTRPSAPTIEYLFPAARVGVYIYTCLSLAQSLASRDRTNESHIQTLEQLDNLLINPPTFIQSSDPTVTRGDPYKLPPVVGEVAASQQKQKERQQNSINAGIIPQFFEVGQLIGERRTWDRLAKSERIREEQSEVRKALNIYTTNINFNTSQYAFAGTPEEKRRMIREDKLPTVQDVIRSDLDARDLYRNEVQTALEDARAEYLYQKRISNGDVNEFETVELVLLLEKAKRAIDLWFSFIPDQDIAEALALVKH